MDISEQKVFDADPKAIHQTNFIAIPDQAGQTAMYFIIEEVVLDFSQAAAGVLL